MLQLKATLLLSIQISTPSKLQAASAISSYTLTLIYFDSPRFLITKTILKGFVLNAFTFSIWHIYEISLAA